ncbi:hypothetical protein Ahp1_16 [Aeromonas phage Ahp1]|uniref:Uncharacterized protein n=1 Tax=Aeromonas phage Ahp1 TaxID=1747286 RepID=A0A1S5Q8D7_9CAUD|nr:hypothetical protein HOS19_gp16 [Aeromonas phage Ahp1]ALP47735.1 hypothetical protein Ahp1_16 [Aeromonas phage Ahp1]
MIEMTKGRARAPFAKNVNVKVTFRNGKQDTGPCGSFDWSWGLPDQPEYKHPGDIVAYDKVEAADEQENA